MVKYIVYKMSVLFYLLNKLVQTMNNKPKSLPLRTTAEDSECKSRLVSDRLSKNTTYRRN